MAKFVAKIHVRDDGNPREGLSGGDGEERTEVRDTLEVKLIASCRR